MPARKAEVKIVVEAYGKRFSLNCEELLHDQFRVKIGRSISKKLPYATLTVIFEEGRKWAVKQKNMRSAYTGI